MRKFQKTGEEGSRLRTTGAANAFTPTTTTTATTNSSTASPAPSRPLPSSTSSAPGRGRGKVPLGPRERPHDFSKQRYGRTHARVAAISLTRESQQ